MALRGKALSLHEVIVLLGQKELLANKPSCVVRTVSHRGDELTKALLSEYALTFSNGGVWWAEKQIIMCLPNDWEFGYHNVCLLQHSGDQLQRLLTRGFHAASGE